MIFGLNLSSLSEKEIRTRIFTDKHGFGNMAKLKIRVIRVPKKEIQDFSDKLLEDEL